jgi:hypothetical protein
VFGLANQNKQVVKMQSKVNICRKFILPFGFLSAMDPRKGPVNAIAIPQMPAVHCQ